MVKIMKEREREQFVFNCPLKLKQQFQRARKKAGYATSSEALRALMREFAERYSPPSKN